MARLAVCARWRGLRRVTKHRATLTHPTFSSAVNYCAVLPELLPTIAIKRICLCLFCIDVRVGISQEPYTVTRLHPSFSYLIFLEPLCTCCLTCCTANLISVGATADEKLDWTTRGVNVNIPFPFFLLSRYSDIIIYLYRCCTHSLLHPSHVP